MKLSDIFTAAAIAANYTEVASNKEAYLGTGFFPAKKKAGLDLKWIKGHKGLPVALNPASFDANPLFRDREGFGFEETQMAFFREGMFIKEADEQEIMRVQESNDPYARQILERIFDDTRNLLDGAEVVPERMRMQLLAPVGGNMGITIGAKGVNYTYNYDPDSEWKKKHYKAITAATAKWSASETCDPMADLEAALDAQQTQTGNRPSIALMSKKTFSYIKNAKKIKDAILSTNIIATPYITNKRVQDFINEELNLTIVIYSKMFKDENGKEHAFYPDNIVMLLPNGTVGNTWYGTTPEERSMGSKEVNVSIVNTGVAVNVTTTNTAPIQTKTTVSEICLPSFERMDETYAITVA